MPLHYRYIAVTLPLQDGYFEEALKVPLHCRYIAVTLPLQDGYFEEALKVRNLLEEFDAQPPGETRPVTIVGFPEHIFTQSSGFVTAIYMAVQERYSGT